MFPSRDNGRRVKLAGATAALVLAYFFFFTGKSLGLYFDQDDMMNLYRAWSQPLGPLLKANVFFWSDAFRPLGALFYRTLYALAGFNPLPFRIACLALAIGNIALCYRFSRLAGGCSRVAALTILLFAFHSRLMEVWFRTAVVYDLLCFTFFYMGACLYIEARRSGRYPSLSRSFAIAVFYVCALNSKEVAVALPAVLFCYEIVLQPVTPGHFRLPMLLGLLNIPYILGKTTGAGAMTNNPAYQSVYTWDRFAHTSAIYLNYIFVRPDDIAPWAAVGILAIMLALAVILRSRQLIFAWLLLFVAALPVSFLSFRGGFVLYIAYAGWCLYAATLLVMLQDLVPGRRRTALASLVFVVVGWRAGKTNLHDQRRGDRSWLYGPPMLVQSLADQIHAFQPRLPRGAHVLFLEDGFGADGWTPYFIVKLLYHDDTLLVDRLKMMNPKPADWSDYQYVFTREAGRYRQLKP